MTRPVSSITPLFGSSARSTDRPTTFGVTPGAILAAANHQISKHK